MPVAHFAKPVIFMPAVSENDGASRHVVFDECGECSGVAARKRNMFDAGDNAESKAPGISEFLDWNTPLMGIPPLWPAGFSILTRPHFDSADHRCLMMSTSPFASRAATYKAFIYFDWMRRADSVTVRPNHPGTKFVKHSECRFISGDIKLTLKLNGGLAGCLRRHEISAPKPRRERHMADCITVPAVRD